MICAVIMNFANSKIKKEKPKSFGLSCVYENGIVFTYVCLF